MERRTKAYEMLLEKEFVFFESASEFISNLIIDIHSFLRCLRTFNDDANSMDFEKAREFLVFIELVPCLCNILE